MFNHKKIRRNVMNMAWIIARSDRSYRFVQTWTPGLGYGRQRPTTAEEKRSVFAAALRQAWATVKMMEENRAERQASARPVAELRAMIEAMENTDTLGAAGIDRLSNLQSELTDAEARDRSEKRKLIEAQAGRIVVVNFMKKDGTERTMKLQPAALKFRAKGQAASGAGKPPFIAGAAG